MKKPRLLRDLITIGVIVLIYLYIRQAGGTHNWITVPPVIRVLLFAAMIVLLCYSVGARIKNLMFPKQRYEYEHIPTSEADHPCLDSQSLSRWTSDFESLGFVLLGDFTVHYLTEGVPNIQFFTRLMLHPVEQCIALSENVFLPSANKTISHKGIVSCFEGGWDVSTSSTKANWVSYLRNMPKEIWSSHPSAAPKELFEIHLQECQHLAGDMALKNATAKTPEDFFAWQKELEGPRREILKKRPALVFFIQWILFLIFSPTKGGSAYAAVLRKKRK